MKPGIIRTAIPAFNYVKTRPDGSNERHQTLGEAAEKNTQNQKSEYRSNILGIPDRNADEPGYEIKTAAHAAG
ncbi:MAG: hypothetical protein O6947_05620, partial [Acidobacteria bacterium]|nr:hypothetical protein [Acidobacteriota bacterium]